MTEKQATLLLTIAKEIGVTITEEMMADYNKMPTREVSNLIDSMIKKRDKANEGKPTPKMLDMLKDMLRCPLLQLAYEEQLVRVPQLWVDGKGRLEGELMAVDKYLDAPYKEDIVKTDIEDLFEVADVMYTEGHISKERYDDVYTKSAEEISFSVIRELMGICGYVLKGTVLVKRTMFEDKHIRMLQVQQRNLLERIAKANALITEMGENFDVNKLDRVTLSNWIEANREEYVKWQNDRATRKQCEFIKELQNRLNRTSGKMEGTKRRYVAVNEGCGLTDQQISCFSRTVAEKYIRQLEKEVYDKELSYIPEEEIRETQIELQQRSPKYAVKTTEFEDMIRHLYSVIGQEPEMIEEEDEEKVFELIRFVHYTLSKSCELFEGQKSKDNAIGAIAGVCEKIYSFDEIYEIINPAEAVAQ